MPNFSGKWNLDGQLRGIKQGDWTGILDQALYVWGGDADGQLGLGTRNITTYPPTKLEGDNQWSDVSTTFLNSSLAITTDGRLFAWGKNYEGNLGLNDLVSRSSPVQVGALTNWSQVSAGRNITAAIKTDGTLWTWGDNFDGELGINDRLKRSSPVQVGSLTTWSKVAVGSVHMHAIKTDGTLWSWGTNENGRLGDNSDPSVGLNKRSSPVQIGSDTDWLNVTAAEKGGAAVKTSGEIYAWGDNTLGTVGDNSVVTRSSPVQIGALTTWSDAKQTDVNHTLALKTDGTLWGWGDNTSGEIGDGSVVHRSSPVQIGALTTWSKVEVGRDGSFMIKTDGTLWATGGDRNRFGSENPPHESSPIQIGSRTFWNKTSVGDACVLALVNERSGVV